MPINPIVDLSHHNNSVDLVKAKADGILAVIHKATQGTAFTDPLYAQHKRQALDAGLLWGAYHFADGSEGVSQAEFFLDAVGSDPGTLLVLDFEANPVGPSMSLVEAQAFVSHISEVTGNLPGFYCGNFFKELAGSSVVSDIADCWLWLAQYGPTPVVPKTFATWTLWQYTDGASGPPPHSVDGIGFCDRDKFNGSPTELQAFWKSASSADAAAAGRP